MTKHNNLRLMWGRFFLLTIIFAILPSTDLGADDLLQRERMRIDSIERASKSFVGVFGPEGQGGGSGVVISADGYAVTNYHVVESCDPFMKCCMNDGALYDAVIVGLDPTGDVALIKLLGRNDFRSAIMADSDLVAAGDECFAVGNPFLLATDFQPSVSWGVVSGVHRYQYPAGTLLEYADCLQTDAAINPGNSGGPLFNSAGELIGINGRGSFEKRGRVNVGVGYAISLNQVKYFLSHLKSGRIVDHATLGATVETADDGKIRVAELLDSSDALRQGLRINDEIVRFGNREIQSVNEFKNVLGIFPKGWRVPLTYRRDGVVTEIVVRLMGVHANEQLIDQVQGPAKSEQGEKGSPVQPFPGESRKSVKEGPQTPIPRQSQYIQRRGFANYYFNQLERDRVWKNYQRHGNFSNRDIGWQISGETVDGKKVELLLNSEKSGLKIGDETYVLEPGSDGARQLAEGGLSRVLIAMHLWRKMLTQGPNQFGSVIYFGNVPGSIKGQMVEVLVGTTGSVEAHFQFDATGQTLLGIEIFSDVDQAPLLVSFSNYRVQDGLSVPAEIDFRQSGFPPQTILIQQLIL